MLCWSGCLGEQVMPGKGIDISQQTENNTVALACLAFFLADHHLLGLCRGKFLKELLMVFRQLLGTSAQIQADRQSLKDSSGWNCHCRFANGVCQWMELPLLIAGN